MYDPVTGENAKCTFCTCTHQPPLIFSRSKKLVSWSYQRCFQNTFMQLESGQLQNWWPITCSCSSSCASAFAWASLDAANRSIRLLLFPCMARVCTFRDPFKFRAENKGLRRRCWVCVRYIGVEPDYCPLKNWLASTCQMPSAHFQWPGCKFIIML